MNQENQMQANQFGMNKQYFYSCMEADGESIDCQFGSASEVLELFSRVVGLTVTVEKVGVLGELTQWSVQILQSTGDPLFEKTQIAARTSSEAVALFDQHIITEMVNWFPVSPSGKRTFLCEGHRSFLWLLDQDVVMDMYLRNHSDSTPETICYADYMNWKSAGYLPEEEWLAMLRTLGALHPDVFTPTLRVQLALQIQQIKHL